MAKLVATRIGEEEYTKLLTKCAGLGCSVYDYLKMLVETDITETKKAELADEQRKVSRDLDERLERLAERIGRA